MQGYEFVDRAIDRSNQRRQAIEDREYSHQRDQLADQRYEAQQQRAIDTDAWQREKYGEEKDYRERRDAITDRRAEEAAAHTRKMALAKSRQEQQTIANKERDAEDQKLVAEALRYGQMLDQGVIDHFPLDLDARLKERRLRGYSPYDLIDDDYMARQMHAISIEQQLAQGNLEYLNTPRGLDELGRVYSDQFSEGVGEYVPGRDGAITAKRPVELKAGPDGSFVVDLEVTLDNGKRYIAQRTINTSANPNDPVALFDAASAMDDIKGRALQAQMSKDLTLKERIGKMYEIAQKQQGGSGKGGDAYFTPMQTSDGFYRFNNRTGEATPLDSRDGSKLMPGALDPEAQADVAGAKESAKLKAKSDAQRQTARPKIEMALQQAESRKQNVQELITSIKPRVGAWTAGLFGSNAAKIPGTPAHDLAKDLSTLQAIAGFEELSNMRAASPTGGALGNVTERELAFLQSVIRNIENSQSPEQLMRNLEYFERAAEASWDRVNQAYQEEYGEATAEHGTAGMPTPGTVEDGYRFLGGNPSDPNSWEALQ